jgi:hypothetical protein
MDPQAPQPLRVLGNFNNMWLDMDFQNEVESPIVLLLEVDC